MASPPCQRRRVSAAESAPTYQRRRVCATVTTPPPQFPSVLNLIQFGFLINGFKRRKEGFSLPKEKEDVMKAKNRVTMVKKEKSRSRN